MQRGSDRLSPRQDEERKHELDGLLRSGHPTRSEEWHDPEPGADDDPSPGVGPASRPGTSGGYEAMRFELARQLGRTPFPAKRGALLRMLHERHAPDQVIEMVESLPPDRTYRTVEDVASDVSRRR
ncbi:DUF2795 domain-containing protein [Streptomyces pactum]|uniref:DUF2795 domain-containing protein n=1 Tax=Streptomyces pactum TaxID=68249 RepID=A0ABS0NR96_9ACTN|nr:DUF2795 domain-containing protein [Streptomyces pactum]MBH5337734.1 DUF2795 domain-containing protein [Streptomyces pactum]